MNDIPVMCSCGWTPPNKPDSSAADQLVAHQMNTGHR